MASLESLVACFQPIFDSSLVYRWTPNFNHLDRQIKNVVDALATLCISKPGEVAAVAIELHVKHPCTLYLATSKDVFGSLESHFQIIWSYLRRVAPAPDDTSFPLNSLAIDLLVQVYNFSWTAFHDRFAPDVADFFVDEFIHQATVSVTKTISDQERRELQELGNLVDILRKTITRMKPTDADMKSVVSTLSQLMTTLQPYVDTSAADTLIDRCCEIGQFHATNIPRLSLMSKSSQ